MTISLFSTYESKGGAARASQRLFEGLNQTHHTINYYVKDKDSSTPNVYPLESKNSIMKEIEKQLQHIYIKYNRTHLTNTLFSLSTNSVKLPNLEKSDIINIHWCDYFLSLENLIDLVSLQKPIVWTLHDMKAFTGGCHYSNQCDEYLSHCHTCLQLQDDPLNLPHVILELKKTILMHANLTIVAPSKWLAKEAKKSSLFNQKRVETIPYGIDSNTFVPFNKETAKDKFNIPHNSIVLSFGVMDHTEKRKGFNELIEALQLVVRNNCHLHIVGLCFGAKASSQFPIPIIDAGFISNDEELSYIYSASDIFILPSLEDNLPNTILESLSCQTPIIAFDTGGAKDIINDTNGVIVPKGDINGLYEAITTLCNDKDLREVKGRQGRQDILQHYQLSHQAQKYLDLFKTLKTNAQKEFPSISLDLLQPLDTLVGQILRTDRSQATQKFFFNQNYSQLCSNITKLSTKNEKYIIYGNGTISKLIQQLIPTNIIGYVDITDENHHPNNLQHLHFDKIIISVLGREEEIMEYLSNELAINQNRIITLSLRENQTSKD